MSLSRKHEEALIAYALNHLLAASINPQVTISLGGKPKIHSATNVRKVKKSKHNKKARAAISKRMKAYWAKRRKQ